MKIASYLGARVALLMLLGLLGGGALLAQSTLGGVNGTITDPTGAMVPGTTVTLSNVGTGVEVTGQSNSSGFFVFVNVQPGNYTLVAEQTGFKTAILPTFNVGVNQTVTQNLVLQVGEVTETIEVAAQAEQLQQSTSELGTVIGVKVVEDLPLNGRNFTQLLTLTPGATPVSTSQSNGIGSNDLANVGVPGASFSNPSIHGQWNRMNIHLLDGLNNTNYIGNMYVIPPIIDAIQEFKVQSHNDKAEFGGVLGGIINVISKTGTNEFHGSLWEFLRNDALNARDPFADEFNEKPAAFRQNQFGAAVGGPIIKNKTFFHAAYEGWRYSRPRLNRYYVPTDAQLGGDFSAWPTGLDIYDPLTTRQNPNGEGLIRTQYPNNVIPGSALNQSMQTYLRGYYDQPNLTGDPQFNVINGDAATNNADNFQIRGDHQFSDLDRAWFRYSRINGAELTPLHPANQRGGRIPLLQLRRRVVPQLLAHADHGSQLRIRQGALHARHPARRIRRRRPSLGGGIRHDRRSPADSQDRHRGRGFCWRRCRRVTADGRPAGVPLRAVPLHREPELDSRQPHAQVRLPDPPSHFDARLHWLDQLQLHGSSHPGTAFRPSGIDRRPGGFGPHRCSLPTLRRTPR